MRKALAIGDMCPNGHLVTKKTAYVYPSTAALAGKVVCKVCRMNWQRKRLGKSESDSIGAWNKDKTHCPAGHEYKGKNLFINKDGSRRCRKCHAMNMRKKNYGIERTQFEDLWKSQKGACAICRLKFKDQSEASVDHDHKTNKVRGLLCNNCNNGLGRFMDKIKYLKAAIEYLESYRG